MLWQISIKTIRQGQYMGNNKEIQRQQYNRTVTMLKQYRDAQFFIQHTTDEESRQRTAAAVQHITAALEEIQRRRQQAERGRVYSVAHVLHAGLYIRADRERIEYRERYTKTLDYGSGKRAGSYGLWD